MVQGNTPGLGVGDGWAESGLAMSTASPVSKWNYLSDFLWGECATAKSHHSGHVLRLQNKNLVTKIYIYIMLPSMRQKKYF